MQSFQLIETRDEHCEFPASVAKNRFHQQTHWPFVLLWTQQTIVEASAAVQQKDRQVPRNTANGVDLDCVLAVCGQLP